MQAGDNVDIGDLFEELGLVRKRRSRKARKQNKVVLLCVIDILMLFGLRPGNESYTSLSDSCKEHALFGCERRSPIPQTCCSGQMAQTSTFFLLTLPASLCHNAHTTPQRRKKADLSEDLAAKMGEASVLFTKRDFKRVNRSPPPPPSFSLSLLAAGVHGGDL